MSGRSAGEGVGYPLQFSWASLVAQLVKNRLQCRRPGFDPWVGKIPLEKGKAEQVPTDLLSQAQWSDFHLTSLSPLTTFLVKEEGVGWRAVMGLHGFDRGLYHPVPTGHGHWLPFQCEPLSHHLEKDFKIRRGDGLWIQEEPGASVCSVTHLLPGPE